MALLFPSICQSLALTQTAKSDCPCFRNYELLNWTTNEESLRRVGRFFSIFHLEPLFGFGSDFVYAKFSEDKVIIRSSCHFHHQVSWFCLLFFVDFFLLRLGPNSFFLVKANCGVFEVFRIYVCVSDVYIDCWITTDSFRVLHAVDSLNVKHELR